MKKKEYYFDENGNFTFKHTEDGVCEILEKFIESFLRNREMVYYGTELSKLGLSSKTISHWAVTKKSSRIIELRSLLKEIQKHKLMNVCATGSNGNVTGSIFLLKCQHGFIESDKQRALELKEKEIAQKDKEMAKGTSGKKALVQVIWEEDES